MGKGGIEGSCSTSGGKHNVSGWRQIHNIYPVCLPIGSDGSFCLWVGQREGKKATFFHNPVSYKLILVKENTCFKGRNF